MSDKKIYREASTVKWHHGDIRQELKPYSFMNMMQEAAGKHANLMNFGYDALQESNQIWVLSRIKVRFEQFPKWGDNVTIETWHKGMQSLFGLRDFILHAEDGSNAVVATSSWLIMNAKTRRIERGNVFNSTSEILNDGNKTNAIETPCDRLKTQPDMEFVREHVVKYSDIDNLMHTNNAKYAEWITDSINFELIKTHRIKEFQINYNSETLLGDKIEIWAKEIETPADIKAANNIPENNIPENNIPENCNQNNCNQSNCNQNNCNSRTLYFEGRKNGKAAFESIFTLVPVE